MKIIKKRLSVISVLLLIVPIGVYSQEKNKIITCKKEAFAALKPLPELIYERPEDAVTESDDRILESPERLKARKEIIKELETFTDPGWWSAAVGDLNACYLRGKPGVLSAEEREQYTSEEYQVRVMGNSQIRLVLTPDPHYQNYFNGSNAYILFRKRGRVYVTEALDGYYSRLAKSISLKLYRVNSRRVVEIETVNISAMRPETAGYYFVINKATNRAIPKKPARKGRRTVLR
ncbi:MAG TPA: hypothetical protein VNH22_06130 [Blastocatellia bacterium]|nr:hypothetical protein [Blastocatellia bacterium]